MAMRGVPTPARACDVSAVLRRGCIKSDKFKTVRRMVWNANPKYATRDAAQVRRVLDRCELTYLKVYARHTPDTMQCIGGRSYLVVVVPLSTRTLPAK